MTIYYREARDRIGVFHSAGYDVAWLNQEAGRLQLFAEASQGMRRTRLRHNGRALRSYARHFGKKKFRVLDDLRMSLIYGDVAITVIPDLHVMEGTQERIIKLELADKQPKPELFKILSQCMLEASDAIGLGIPSSSILVYDVSRGSVHKLARSGARTATDIANACLNISAIWEGI